MDNSKGASSTRQSTRLKQMKFPKNVDNSGANFIDLEGSSTRQSKRLKQMKFDKTSYSHPQNLDATETTTTNQRDSRNQSDSDDDFEQPPKTKNKTRYDTELVSESGLQRERRSKNAADIPSLTPKSIAAQGKFKIRAIKKKNVQEEADRERNIVKRKLDVEQEVEAQRAKKKVTHKTKKTNIRLVDETTDEDEPPEAHENQKRKQKGNVPEKIPHRLAYYVFQSFDASSRELKLPNGSITITNQDVHDVLGLPIGQQSFNFATTSARKNLWTSQFPGKPQYNISPSMVIDVMKDMTEDSELFKLNFLIIVSNGLIERNTTTYVIRDILDYDIDLDNCAAYNWGEYLISCLVTTKNNWHSLKSLFYPGPIVFLTIFYVDRVLKGEKEIERTFPAFKGWTTKLLKARQAEEMKSDCFGSGTIIEARTEKQRAQDNNAFEEHDKEGYAADNEHVQQENEENDDFVHAEQQTDSTIQCSQPRPPTEPTQEDIDRDVAGQDEQPPNPKPREEDWFARLSVKAVTLLDALEAYRTEMEEAKLMHPNELSVSDTELKVTERIQKVMQSSTKQKDGIIPESENEDEMEDQQKDVQIQEDFDIETNVEMEQQLDMEPAEIDPDVLEHVELIEYLYSSQGIKDMNEYMDDLSVPSFSLGLDEEERKIRKDINKENGELQTKAQCDEDHMVTPAPTTHEKKNKREMKLAAARRSPYVRRIIDLNEKYSTQHYAVWRWIIQKGKNPLEHVFKAGDLICIRKHMATLRPRKKLYYSVIDVWSALMNEKETYRAAESPKRLFFNTGLSIAPLDERKSEDTQYNIFVTEMKHFLEKYPNAKFSDYDLIFFPILAYEHFYLICLNIKTKAWDVIDNIRHAKAANNVHMAKLRRLKKHFAKYMRENDESWFAASVTRMKTNYLTMPWQTFQNKTDCGVFLMRHMETYKGDKKDWETQFKIEEKAGHQEQLVRLRIKYADAILTSHVNEKSDIIIKESRFLYNKLAGQGLLKVIMESSKKSRRERHVTKGTVLFPADDADDVGTDEDNVDAAANDGGVVETKEGND